MATSAPRPPVGVLDDLDQILLGRIDEDIDVELPGLGQSLGAQLREDDLARTKATGDADVHQAHGPRPQDDDGVAGLNPAMVEGVYGTAYRFGQGCVFGGYSLGHSDHMAIVQRQGRNHGILGHAAGIGESHGGQARA